MARLQSTKVILNGGTVHLMEGAGGRTDFSIFGNSAISDADLKSIYEGLDLIFSDSSLELGVRVVGVTYKTLPRNPKVATSKNEDMAYAQFIIQRKFSIPVYMQGHFVKAPDKLELFLSDLANKFTVLGGVGEDYQVTGVKLVNGGKFLAKNI